MISRKVIILFLMVFLLIASTALGEWWNDISYNKWSAEQADRILNNSPWVGLAPAAPAKRSGSYALARYIPIYYQVRLLTARPVREGILRLTLLGVGSATIDIKKINKNGNVEYDNETQQGLLNSYLKDVGGQGYDQYIVLSLTLKEAYWDRSTPSSNILVENPKYQELTNPEELSNIDISRIKSDTILRTSKDRHVGLLTYIKPGEDRLGAKFCFPRNLTDGTPLVTEKDKELTFETRVNNIKIKVKFDPRKMLYKGKLEF